jgi:hypothetical protein
LVVRLCADGRDDVGARLPSSLCCATAAHLDMLTLCQAMVRRKALTAAQRVAGRTLREGLALGG